MTLFQPLANSSWKRHTIPFCHAGAKPSRSRRTVNLLATNEFLLEAPPHPCHPERSRGTCCAPFPNATANVRLLGNQGSLTMRILKQAFPSFAAGNQLTTFLYLHPKLPQRPNLSALKQRRKVASCAPTQPVMAHCGKYPTLIRRIRSHDQKIGTGFEAAMARACRVKPIVPTMALKRRRLMVLMKFRCSWWRNASTPESALQ